MGHAIMSRACGFKPEEVPLVPTTYQPVSFAGHRDGLCPDSYLMLVAMLKLAKHYSEATPVCCFYKLSATPLYEHSCN